MPTNRIKQLRLQAKHSQSQLARLAGLSQSAVSTAERGDRIAEAKKLKIVGALEKALGQRLNLTDVFPDESKETNSEQSYEVPEIPPQGASLHFAIQGELIAAVPSQYLADDQNDYARLDSLFPLVSDSLSAVCDVIQSGNKPYIDLEAPLKRYSEELGRGTRNIDYNRLYAYGITINSTLRKIDSLIDRGELPELDPNAHGAFDTFQALHGPFILASKDGRELVIDAERYARNPSEERAYRHNAKEFIRRLSDRKDIIESETASFLKDVSNIDDADSDFERKYRFLQGAMKNLVIVMSAGSVVVTSAFIPYAGPYVAAALGLITFESVKKSKSFQEFTAPVGQKLDELGEFASRQISGISRVSLERIRKFIIANKRLISGVSKSNGDSGWIKEVIDYITVSRSHFEPFNENLEDALAYLQNAKNSGEEVFGEILAGAKGGYEVQIGPVRAFLPKSQSGIRPNDDISHLIGSQVLFNISNVDRDKRTATLSRKRILLKSISPGEVLEGEITGIQDYGVFVEIGAGVVGLLHRSKMGSRRKANIESLFSIGDKLTVRVHKNDGEKKLSLALVEDKATKD